MKSFQSFSLTNFSHSDSQLSMAASVASAFCGSSEMSLPFPSPGDLPNPGIEPGSPALQTDALPSEPLGKPDVQYAAAAAAKLLQSCPTLCDPMNRLQKRRGLTLLYQHAGTLRSESEMERS